MPSEKRPLIEAMHVISKLWQALEAGTWEGSIDEAVEIWKDASGLITHSQRLELSCAIYFTMHGWRACTVCEGLRQAGATCGGLGLVRRHSRKDKR
jgi:hypothetical protein